LTITSANGNATFAGTVTTTQLLAPVATLSNTTAETDLYLTSNAGYARAIRFTSAGSTRWIAYTDSSTESGANAGSNFKIDAYADNSSGINTWLAITRATGVVTLNSSVVSSSTSTGALIVGGGVGIAGTTFMGGNLYVAGTASIGALATTFYGLSTSGTLSGAVTQIGIVAENTFNASATNSGTAIYAQPIFAASNSGTPTSYGIIAATPSIGSGTTLSQAIGLYVAPQTGTGINTGYAIYTNTGAVRFGDALTVVGAIGVGTGAIASRAINVQGITLTGTSTQYGIVSNPTFDTGATVEGAAMYAAGALAASTAMTNCYGMVIDNPSLGSGASISINTGLVIFNQTAGSTNYAIKTGTGLVSFGDQVSVTKASGVTFVSQGSGTNSTYCQWNNTGGTADIGIDNSAGNSLVSTGGVAYALSLVSPVGKAIVLATNGGAAVLTLASAGTSAFTGTVQAAGYLSSDGTTGLTQASTTTAGKSITVKNGLIVAFA